MKLIQGPDKKRVSQSLGPGATVFEAWYVVEEGDVGRVLHDKDGHGYSCYQVKASDVGRQRVVYTDGTGWTNWVWALVPLEVA